MLDWVIVSLLLLYALWFLKQLSIEDTELPPLDRPGIDTPAQQTTPEAEAKP